MVIYDAIKAIKDDADIVCIGMAASMAAILLAGGQKGNRFITRHAKIMIHEPLGGVNGQATEIKIVAERILKLKLKLNKILAKNTKKSLSKIEKDVERDYYMDSKDALDYGLIDKII